MQSKSNSSSDTESEEEKTQQKVPIELEDSSSSSEEESEKEPTPPPSPKKKKKKKKDKKKEMKATSGTDGLEQRVTFVNTTMDLDEPTLDHSKEPVHTPTVKKNKKKRKNTELIPTSNPNVVVEMKKRKKGPRTQKVVVYEEDIPPPKFKIVHKTHKKGRPKTKSDIIQEKDEGIEMNEEEIIIHRPTKKKEMSAKQLRRMELDAEFVKMEQISGRKLRQTKSGKVDKRCLKERSPAQIAAARRLAEYNKELRKQKADQKNREAVKDVITELAVTQMMHKKEDKQQPEVFDDPNDLFD
jgi:hypothetical protein